MTNILLKKSFAFFLLPCYYPQHLLGLLVEAPQVHAWKALPTIAVQACSQL